MSEVPASGKRTWTIKRKNADTPHTACGPFEHGAATSSVEPDSERVRVKKLTHLPLAP